MRPLADVRIVALEQYGAGPYGSLHLADLGADVIKVEDPRSGGDVGRYVPPFRSGESSLFFETFNRNKRSISLDLSASAGRAVFDDLVRVSDAVYSNLRGDVPQKIGITYADLAHLNPRIVCCSLSGFGMSGSGREAAGYDYIVQGMTGWMALTGDPEGPPTKSGPSLADYSGGLVAALALMAGLHAARRDGIGTDCDVSLFDTALSMLGYPATWWLNEGYDAGRTRDSAHPSLVPFQSFPTADGWIVVACPKEKFWRRLTQALGRPELADDRRYSSFEARRNHAEQLRESLMREFTRRPAGQWLELLNAYGVPCGPVNTLPDALAEPHADERGMLVDVPGSELGVVREVASPVRVGEGQEPARCAPRRGEHTHEVLTELLGYDEDHIAAIARGGAFGTGTQC